MTSELLWVTAGIKSPAVRGEKGRKGGLANGMITAADTGPVGAWLGMQLQTARNRFRRPSHDS